MLARVKESKALRIVNKVFQDWSFMSNYENCQKQTATLQDPLPHVVEEESVAYKKWEHLSTLEEGFLKQKLKLHWLNVGDHNNKYFHQTAVVRKMGNSIREIVTPNGEILNTDSDINGKQRDISKTFLVSSQWITKE